jgi:hypothetical protein
VTLDKAGSADDQAVASHSSTASPTTQPTKDLSSRTFRKVMVVSDLFRVVRVMKTRSRRFFFGVVLSSPGPAVPSRGAVTKEIQTMRRKIGFFLSSAILTLALGGSMLPAHASDGTSLVDCVKNGGHASGKYCSGGGDDGRLIVA